MLFVHLLLPFALRRLHASTLFLSTHGSCKAEKWTLNLIFTHSSFNAKTVNSIHRFLHLHSFLGSDQTSSFPGLYFLTNDLLLLASVSKATHYSLHWPARTNPKIVGHVQLVGFILSGISTLGKKIKFLIGCVERLALLYRRNPTIIKFQYSRVSSGDQQLAKKPEGSGYEFHGKRFDRVLVDFQVLRPFRQIIHSSLRTLGAINLTVESKSLPVWVNTSIFWSNSPSA